MSPKPTAQRRRDRRALLDNLLGRMLRGRLSAAEAALLAETVREEQRAYDQTRRSLAETGTAYGKHRAAAADAVREAEADAERYKADHLSACQTIAAMHAAATGRTGMAPIRGVVEDVADMRARMLAAEEALGHAEAAASRSEQAAEDHRGALSYALGLGYGASWAVIHERARKLRDADESAREGWEEAAQQRARATGWRAHAVEADDRADRYKAAWRSARARAAKHLTEQQRVRGWCAHWADRARLAEQALAGVHRDAVRALAAWRSARARAAKRTAQLATTRQELEQALETAAVRGAALTAHLARAARSDEPATVKRCPSCEHAADYHTDPAGCWFTVADGKPDRDAVCGCRRTPAQ
jgi:hypothetical protein